MDVLEDTNEMYNRYDKPTDKFIEEHGHRAGNLDEQWTDFVNEIKGMSTGIPWKEAWFNLRFFNDPLTEEMFGGSVIPESLLLVADKIRTSEYYDHFFIGIPKKEPALVDLDNPAYGPKYEAYMYIYDRPEGGPGQGINDSVIGLSKDGTISLAIGYNPRISRDVWVRKLFLPRYIAENYEDWMDTMNFFMEHVFNEDSE